jgi:acyl-CoA thioesterase-1
MRWTSVALLAFLAVFCTSGCKEDSPTSPGGGRPVIVAFGDSLTSGPGLRPDETYPALLQRRIASEGRDYRMVNAGVTGDTSTEALRRFDAALVPDTKIVILAIGGNDGLRGVPVATLERNIAAMI